jgi:hypothetical protein
MQIELRTEYKTSWDSVIKLIQVNFSGRPFYQFGIGLFKLALCVSYLRLLSGTSKKLYRIIIIAIATISTLGHFAWTLVLIFNCNPVRLITVAPDYIYIVHNHNNIFPG